MGKFYLFFILMWSAGGVEALQVKNIMNNETVSATISPTDMTRIFVEGDRIKSVKGLKGAYTRENDEINGEIYLQPTPFYQNQTFTVMIETEQDNHFTLLLKPDLTAKPDALMLVPKGTQRKKAIRFEEASDYELTLTHLVRAMATHELPEGYRILEVNSKKTKKYIIGHSATLHLKTIYQGTHYQGELYELTNTQAFPITLDERQFFNSATCAISLERRTILPHNKIQVLRVVSYA